MTLEEFVTTILKQIKTAAEHDANYKLELDKETAKEIAKLYDDCEWIEIY